MRKLKTHFLLVVLTTVALFSCFDAVDDIDYKIVNDSFSFVKCYVESYSNQYVNTTIVRRTITINECMVGDTIGLICYVDGDIRPKSLTVRITTSKGDIEFIKLLDDPNMAYFAIVPRPPHQYIAYLPNEDMYPHLPEPFLLSNIPISYESKPEVRNGILSVSPDGDIIIAEIIGGCKIQRIILNVKSK